MKYVKEHEFTFLGNYIWGSCDNQIMGITNMIYIGKDDIFEFEML